MTLSVRQDAISTGDGWWDWSIWLDGPDEELDQIGSVTYTLHETFPEPIQTRTNRADGFRLQSSGWDGFTVRIRARARNGTTTDLEHPLVLGNAAADPTEPPGPGGRQPKIFLSYAAADKIVAVALEAYLKANGWSIATTDSVALGSNWIDSIADAIKSADAMIVIVSDAAGDWVNAEVESATALRRPVVPLIIGVVEELPASIRGLEAVHLDGIEHVARAAASLLTRLSPPPPNDHSSEPAATDQPFHAPESAPVAEAPIRGEGRGGLKKTRSRFASRKKSRKTSESVEDLLLAAVERGDDSLETGRYVVTFKESANDEGLRMLMESGLRVANARDFDHNAVAPDGLGDADAVMLPEIGVALVGATVALEHGLSTTSEIAADSPVEAIEPEYFVFPAANLTDRLREAVARRSSDINDHVQNAAPKKVVDPAEYLRGFARAAQAIAGDLTEIDQVGIEAEEDSLVLGATWGLIRSKAPPSLRSGVGIRVAVLDTGFDLGHPDFVGRMLESATFVGEPVQDLNSHGTHMAGTVAGPKSPPGATPRYGTAYRASLFVGKVLTNSGTGSTGSVLAGLNWAIANRAVVITLSFSSQAPVQAAYTAAGTAALAKGSLIIAAAGNAASITGAPANSPTIVSVAALDPNLAPSSFSNFGKIEIAGPGRDVFASLPRPTRYGIRSGTSMAAAHVAGCAALWAETSTSLRGIALWRKLLATARHLPFPPARVGAGLVQAP